MSRIRGMEGLGLTCALEHCYVDQSISFLNWRTVVLKKTANLNEFDTCIRVVDWVVLPHQQGGY